MAQNDSDRLLTSHQVGELLQVNPSSINKWVNDGRIPAFRTPGGHRRIRIGDLVAFLEKHKMPVPRSLTTMGRRRLLIVDDNQKHLDGLKRRLKGYADRVELAVAASGIDALIQIGAFKPNVVIIDVYMPELDGLEVCRRIKANPETHDVDVLMTSGLLTPEVEEEAAAAGASRCLQKPIDIATLLEHLDLLQSTP